MLVQPVVIPGSGMLSWTVLGDDDVPVVPVDRFLAYLTDIGRSPNTLKAYAHDLKDFWGFIGLRGLDWRATGQIASLMGAIKIESLGTQNHRFTTAEFQARLRQSFPARPD